MRQEQTSTEKLNTKIERRNAKFAKLTKAQKRAAIARDALKQLRLGLVKAEHGTYMRTGGPRVITRYPDGSMLNDVRQLCDVLPTRTCAACALGTLFVAGVACKDKLTVGEANRMAGRAGFQGAMHEYLGDVFSERQLLQIEMYFEHKWEMANARKTLTAILRNIIRNGGTFKVSDPHDDAIRQAARSWQNNW